MFGILYNLFLAYLLGDLLTGIYHWIKDTYFGPFTPIIGKTFIWNSRLHHIKPQYILEFSDWELFYDSAKWTLLWILPLFYLIGVTPFLLMLLITIAFNDVIHKYSHLIDSEKPYWISLLQKMYIFQSYEQHHLHHVSPHEINYCPITPLLNPILEKFQVWRKLEDLIEHHLGYVAREIEYQYVEDVTSPGGIRFLPSK